VSKIFAAVKPFSMLKSLNQHRSHTLDYMRAQTRRGIKITCIDAVTSQSLLLDASLDCWKYHRTFGRRSIIQPSSTILSICEQLPIQYFSSVSTSTLKRLEIIPPSLYPHSRCFDLRLESTAHCCICRTLAPFYDAGVAVFSTTSNHHAQSENLNK